MKSFFYDIFKIYDRKWSIVQDPIWVTQLPSHGGRWQRHGWNLWCFEKHCCSWSGFHRWNEVWRQHQSSCDSNWVDGNDPILQGTFWCCFLSLSLKWQQISSEELDLKKKFESFLLNTLEMLLICCFNNDVILYYIYLRVLDIG